MSGLKNKITNGSFYRGLKLPAVAYQKARNTRYKPTMATLTRLPLKIKKVTAEISS